jgi:DNA-binding CsgD family transcriptional regulator
MRDGMVDIALDNRMQSAVRRLLMAEPEPGVMLPSVALHSLGQLIGCDRVGLVEADRSGYCLRRLALPQLQSASPQVCDGPLPRGLMHDATMPPDQRDAAHWGLRDQIRLGFNTHSGTVVQLYFERRPSFFSELDVAILTMLEPAIGRLIRRCAGESPCAELTASERKVLDLVATGASNRDVAEELYVTVHTVRKHLENAYRKLGVTNRTAAAQTVRTNS